MELIEMICLAILILAAVAVCLIIAKRQSGHTFLCKHCGKTFQPKWAQLVFEIHVLDEHKIRCPHCNEKDFCKDKGRSAG